MSDNTRHERDNVRTLFTTYMDYALSSSPREEIVH